MRPIRLEVEGFTCYRDSQVLEFSDLSLFAIAGPTGAGKSSILDTILFALYGHVPRIGRQGVGELISHGRDRLSVCLDFGLRGSRYRVTRTAKRSSKGQLTTTAMLADVSSGPERSLAEQVRPVNEAVAALLGLGYDDFTQTVILPQGEFDRFLRADPRDQRAILQHLLRHHVFERMRVAAEARRNDMSGTLKGVEGRLAMCADATGEALAEREAQLDDARTAVAASATARDAATSALQDAQVRRRLTEEVEQLREKRSANEREALRVDLLRAELASARRAAGVLPRLEALADASRRAEQARAVVTTATKASDGAAASRATAAGRADSAIAAARECDALAARVRRLDEIAGNLARRVEISSALKAQAAQLTAADVALAKARKADTTARKALGERQAALQSLRDEHETMPFDAALHAALGEVVEPALHAKGLEREAATLAVELSDAARLRAVAAKAEAAAQAANQKARARADKAEELLATARRALEDGRTRDRATALRAHLHAGDRCPVCLQDVAVVPAVEMPPELTSLEEGARAAEEAVATASRAFREAADTLVRAEARRAEAAQAAETLTAKTTACKARLAEVVEELRRTVPQLAELTPPWSPDEPWAGLTWMDEQRARLAEARAAHDRRDAAIRKAEHAVSDAQLTTAQAEGDRRQATSVQEHQQQEQVRLQAELAAVIARIQAVSTHADPREEREALHARITALREAEVSAREALARANLAVAEAEVRLAAAEAASADAEAQATAAAAQLTQALVEAGLATEADARAALRLPAAQAGLEQQIAAFDDRRGAVLQRLLELEPQVAGKELSAAALADVERRAQAATGAWLAASQAVTALEAACARLREDVHTRKRLEGERDSLHAALSVTAELATDLRGDRFQAYLLEEAFHALVAGASVRMKAISNRYTLEWDDGNFFVADHDNAGERRRAETLSGGETFMASLCLALQLSEEVLRATGAVRMDSLFIDEGFGTLDSDALSEVTDAIEALRHDGGRLVGVISHRTELTDRLPGCVRIEKGAGMSRWQLERVG